MQTEQRTKVEQIVFAEDPYQMNWLRPDFEYAGLIHPQELSARAVHYQDGNLLKTEITFKNVTEAPVLTSVMSIGIRFPLQDRYEDSDTCMKYRCHAHLFCGGNVSYIMALRMGGEAPHLGMVLTEGSFSAYSVERDTTRRSNDRGCFILHPAPAELVPGEELRFCWTVFPHGGKEDFYEKAAGFGPFVRAEAKKYVLFPGETTTIRILPNFPVRSITAGGADYPVSDGYAELTFTADHCGEVRIPISAGNVKTWIRLMVQEQPETLALKRCRFIAEHQQYTGKCPTLKGAYLAYDNEEEHVIYLKTNDYNAGRERVGMGLLIASYLQKNEDPQLRKSLDEYARFVCRELVDTDTGEVYNDTGRDSSYKRLYNMPWYATLFTEFYRLYKDALWLHRACRIIRNFYSQGGSSFYAIELPALSLCSELKQAGCEEEYLEMKQLFAGHANRIAEIGHHYPPSEVNYEQSIVAPAANILLQAYLLTREEKYLEEGKKQLAVLELFNGQQPDYHLYESAVRHWDGYWFGKRKLYGDTFPHYWSALTGIVYGLYASATGDKRYEEKAEASLRGVLSLIFPNGRGSCAYVYPYSVNGTEAGFYDPYANDQDWALYFTLRAER